MGQQPRLFLEESDEVEEGSLGNTENERRRRWLLWELLRRLRYWRRYAYGRRAPFVDGRAC